MDEERIDGDTHGMDRRAFLKRAGAVGAAAAWAAPVIQTITAGPAFAQTGTPAECFHSIGDVRGLEGTDCEGEGCMGACQTACGRGCAEDLSLQGSGCQQACDQLCPIGTEDRQCCNAGVCVLSNWSCTPGTRAPDDNPCYEGPTGGGLFTCPIGCLQD